MFTERSFDQEPSLSKNLREGRLVAHDSAEAAKENPRRKGTCLWGSTVRSINRWTTTRLDSRAPLTEFQDKLKRGTLGSASPLELTPAQAAPQRGGRALLSFMAWKDNRVSTQINLAGVGDQMRRNCHKERRPNDGWNHKIPPCEFSIGLQTLQQHNRRREKCAGIQNA